MRWSTIFLFLLSTMALGGCKKESVAAPEAAPEAPQPKALSALASPAIKILEPGAEPRRELRARNQPTRKQKLKIQVDHQLDAVVSFLNMKRAPRSLTFELVVQGKGVESEETGVFAFTIEKIGLDLAKELPLKTRKSWESAIAAMRGTKGSYLVDSFGTVRRIEVKSPSDASREYWEMAADLDWALQQLGVPFPSEAIGAGAQWSVEQRVEQDGIDASEVSTLAITKLGTLVAIEKDAQQSAAPQTFRNPGSTVDAELLELSGEAAGQINWDRTQPLPRSAKITSTVTKRITYPSEGKRQEAAMVTRRTLLVADE